MKTFWSVFFAILAAVAVIVGVAAFFVLKEKQEQGWRDAANATLEYGNTLAYSINSFAEKSEVEAFNKFLLETPNVAEKLDAKSRREFNAEVRRLHSIALFGTKSTAFKLNEPPPEWP